MKSQGEIEAAVCDGIARFQQDFIGRGPRDIHAHLVGTLLVVRLQGVLTPAERQLIAPPYQPPPRMTRSEANASSHHSQTFPCMSYRPQPFATPRLPTSTVFLREMPFGASPSG